MDSARFDHHPRNGDDFDEKHFANSPLLVALCSYRAGAIPTRGWCCLYGERGSGILIYEHWVPSSARIALNGLDAAFTLDVSPRLGARVDVGYVRASHALNSGHHSDVLSYLAGPVFYPVRNRKLPVFAQGLLGAARVTGPVPVSSGGFLTGYVNQFAWAVGTGAEFRVSESIGVRIGTDYLHTRFFNSSTAISGQGNLRITVSLVYFFGRHPGQEH